MRDRNLSLERGNNISIDLEILTAIQHERHRQYEKFGDQTSNTPLEWAAIVAEESGEACKASVNHTISLRDGMFDSDSSYNKSISDLMDELVQTAAVSINALECLKRKFPNAWKI